MENAKQELIEHIEDRKVQLVRIIVGKCYEDNRTLIEGTLEQVLPMLDFNYDSSYGAQYLYGYIWYKDGTWSERGEYDGTEWWEYKKRPEFDVDISEL